MSNFPSLTIDKFLGLNLNTDKLDAIPGQLVKNNNYLYMTNGGLEERGGGMKLTDPPSAGRCYALENYIDGSGDQWLITIQGTKAYYYNSGWVDLGLTLTSNKTARFDHAGFSTTRALYGVNENNSIIKIVTGGGVPTASIISGANVPTNAIDIKLHKNRLFAIAGDTLYFTDALAFDTWTATNIQIAPGVDGFCKALEVYGDALFIFKENGVYVLPNADDADPVNNWSILRTDAIIGTQSPDTVERTKIGIIYLSTDNFIRLIAPSITFSSGEYTLGGSGSPIISDFIQSDLNSTISNQYKGTAQSTVFMDKYIVGYRTTSNTSDYNDRWYFCDLSKFLSSPNNPQPQPYWGNFTGFTYDFFATQKVNGRDSLYGVNSSGEVHETLNGTIHSDNGNPIESEAILNWIPIAGDNLYKKFVRTYVVADTENWDLNLRFNAYKYNSLLPEDDEGITRTYRTSSTVGGIVGTAIVGTSIIGQIGTGSEKYRLNLKGNYFNVAFYNLNANEYTRVNKLVAYYRPIRTH